MLCLQCGNEIPEDHTDCPVCAANSERGSLVPDEGAAAPDEPRYVFCRTCGNEYVEEKGCPVCADKATRWRNEDDDKRRLCLSCGNEIVGGGACPICAAGKAPRKRARLKLCPKCGNEVEDIHQCPICLSGRAGKRKRAAEPEGAVCAQCEHELEEQDWDGVTVLMCAECGGCFFLDNGLERTLDKLREATEPRDISEIMADLKGRRFGTVAKAVRYRPCPVCREFMVRRNYGGVSGIMIDVCGPHGIWVTQHAFGELSEFVSLGGDAIAKHRHKPRTY
jgi:Zn-finger nucleic acid-binding protein